MIRIIRAKLRQRLWKKETLEELVVYKHLDTGEIWVRQKKMFLEKVDIDGKKVPRFKYLKD